MAANYGGKVTVGLNRRLDNLPNTIAAATLAYDEMSNLYAIELGNEPNCVTCPPFSNRRANHLLQSSRAATRLQMVRVGLLPQTTHPRSRGRMPYAGVYPPLI